MNNYIDSGHGSILKKLLRFAFDNKYRFMVLASKGFCNHMNDKKYIEKVFEYNMGYSLDLNNPQTFNEKLQWLKLYDRKPEYTTMVDKYTAKKYVADKIGEQYVIPTLGVWDNPDEIDFDKLPDQFVLKCNHNSGLGMCICRDKFKLNIDNVRAELKKGLKQNYYLSGREWPYKDVPRKIIAEKYMEDQETKGLIDYKIYTFNGVPKIMGIYCDRPQNTQADYFDRDFNCLGFKWGYPHIKNKPEKPKRFEEMFELAGQLAKGTIELRVDFYEVNEKIYFGELTFFDGSGFDRIEPKEFDLELGELIKLPEKRE